MSKFIDRVFSLEKAYSFEFTAVDSLQKYLFRELVYQLKDLEQRWMELFPERKEKQTLRNKVTQYELCLEQISFRLKEITRFTETSSGPKIIRFICSEIYDLLQEKRILNQQWTSDEVSQISVIFTVLNSFFQEEVHDLDLISFEEISQRLKEAMQPLLNR